MSIKSFVIPSFVFVLVLLAFAFLGTQTVDWNTWRISSCMPDGCFCEAIREGETIRQPANTYSSLAYTLVGLLLVGHLFSIPAQRPLTKNLAYLFAAALIILGIGSALYHASLTFIWQFADVFGMFLVVNFMLVYAWYRLYKFSSQNAAILYMGLNIIFGLLIYFIPAIRREMFTIVLLLGIGFEIYYAAFRKPSLKRYWFAYGLGLFATAYIIWIFDNNGTLCSPDSLLQGHAVWHIFGAIATGLLYRYYHSESPSHAHE